MSLDPSDLDDCEYDTSSGTGTGGTGAGAATSWAVKLGAAYPVVGFLYEYREANRLPRELFVFDPSNVLNLERQPSVSTAQPGSIDKGKGGQEESETSSCPITGQQGTACPLGFGGTAAVDTVAVNGAAECPFPFIFLHDPVKGWEQHRSKAIWSTATVAVVLLAVMLMAGDFLPALSADQFAL